MDQKTLDLVKQGKYLGAVKNYVEVVTEEANNMQHLADPLFQQEQTEIPHHSSPRNTGGRNVNRVQHHAPKSLQMQTGQSTHSSPNLQQRHQFHHKKVNNHKQHPIKSLRPHNRPITKESIIKVERNSSVGSVAFSLMMMVVLLVVFVLTL